ncbi:MAG: hypothetical protein ABJF88_04700 [Rhodothermales bacterium]
MPEAREDARKQYSKTRAEFEKLETQDKTAFVLEATFATIGQAIEETGRQFADVLDRAANFDFGSWREEGDESDAPNPAAPPTSDKRAPSRGKKSSEEDE